MKKWILSLITVLSLVGISSCNDEEPKKSEYSEYLFFNELYNGESINDCVLEIGTTKEKSFSLNEFKINFYDSNSIDYTYEFKDENINKDNLILFVNKQSTYTNDISTIIKLDDNYICGMFYVELIDDKGIIVDTLGYKGHSSTYVRNASYLRLDEYRTGKNEFNELDFVTFRNGYTSNLGYLDCPITVEELLEGPKLDTSLYGDLSFSEDGIATNGYVDVEINSLGDGDTTYFEFPQGSGIENDYNNRVRYLLINTPEIDHGDESNVGEEPFGNEAKEYNNSKLNSATKIVVQSSKDAGLKDTYSRTLGFVWYTTKENPTYEDLILLNFELVKVGLAYLSDGDYKSLYFNDVLYQDYFKYAKAKAMEEKLNIYS